MFLYKVYQKDKILFAVFTLFILGQIFFTYKHVENTPFFHYGMYSSLYSAQPSYTVYNITVDKQSVRSNDFPDYQREVVYNTLSCYDGLKQMNYHDSLDRVISKRFSGGTANRFRTALLNTAQMDTPYQKWLFHYIADMRMVSTPVIQVSKRQVSYQPDGSLIATGHLDTLFQLRDE